LGRQPPFQNANSAWGIEPLNENGWVNYDLASGVVSATNGVMVTHGDTTIWADSLTLNQQTGEVVASGSVKIQSGTARSATEIEPVNKNEWVKYDAAKGTAMATNEAVLRKGDQVIKADNITFDETGRVTAKGHPVFKSASANETNLQLAQVQPSIINPTRTLQTSNGRRRILNKLEAIRLNHVAFDNLPLSEVVNLLRDEAKKRDPEGKGINFILNPNANLDAAAGPPAIDPATGLQVPLSQSEPADINGVAIRIMPPLEDVRMIDVLDAITKVADKRIRYFIEDYGVSFRLAGGDTLVPLFTRVIKVDPNVFAQGLESVVGFSVGNFQTGGQGGGGQGNSSGVTVPRVQVAPNIGGQGGQAGAGGAQGGAGGISGVTRPTTMTTQQAVRQLFVNAGVDLTPPKSVFFNDRAGTLLVHASLNDLDIIERAVGALSTTAAQPATTRAAVQADQAGPATVRVYTNEQFLGEQKVALSPGKNLFTFPSNSVPSTTNQAKLPVLGDLPVVGSQFQLRTAQLAAANSPQQITNAANGDTGAKLLTFTSLIRPDTFREGLRTVVPLADDASPQETMDAFRKLVLSSGVQLAPPANMSYNERNGILVVRAIPPEMEAIQQIVQKFNYSPPQVNIRARFVEVSEDNTNLIAINSDTNGPVLGVLTDPQFRVVLHALEQRDGVDVVSPQSVTTVSGRQAQIQHADIQTIVKLNPQALVPPGAHGAYITEPLSSGPLLDVIPYVAESGEKIQLAVTATVTEFVGYDPPEPGDAAPVYVDGKATKATRPHPRIHVRTMQAGVNIYDGQTVVLGRPTDEMITFDKDGKALSTPSATKKNLLVFVTATLIDAAGNPVHSLDSPSSPPQR